MYFTLKIVSGKGEQNIRILIKFCIFWFYSKYPSSFWLSYSSFKSYISDMIIFGGMVEFHPFFSATPEYH